MNTWNDLDKALSNALNEINRLMHDDPETNKQTTQALITVHGIVLDRCIEEMSPEALRQIKGE